MRRSSLAALLLVAAALALPLAAASHGSPFEWRLTGGDEPWTDGPHMTFGLTTDPDCGFGVFSDVTGNWWRGTTVCVTWNEVARTVAFTGHGVDLSGITRDRSTPLCHAYGGLAHQEAHTVDVTGTILDDEGDEHDVWFTGVVFQQPRVPCSW